MEADLDSIASGDVDEKAELKNFYDSFEPLYNNAVKNMDAKYPIMTDEKCPICGNPIAIKFGKFGEFKSCNNYPHCNYIVKRKKKSHKIQVLYVQYVRHIISLEELQKQERIKVIFSILVRILENVKQFIMTYLQMRYVQIVVQ